jgi:hypothetical protein
MNTVGFENIQQQELQLLEYGTKRYWKLKV